MDFKYLDERICVLRMKGRFHKYSFSCAHSPIEGKEDYEKYYFYDDLEKCYDECPKFGIKICLGDFTVMVRKANDSKPGTGQNRSDAESNDNVDRLKNCAVSKKRL